MKNIISKLGICLLLGTSFSACTKLDDINVDPLKINKDQVQVEYLFNDAIIQAQQDPNIAERIFVLYWKNAARQHLANGIATGGPNDGWSNEYWGRGYGTRWLSSITEAIKLGQSKIDDNSAEPYMINLVQFSRIWRAYLMSEITDNFGPIPINGFEGENPTYNSVQEVYTYLLAELKDAVSKIDETKSVPKDKSKFDAAYGFDTGKWLKYANSMRMRLAMRIAEVEPSLAKSEFEDAVKGGKYIKTLDEKFEVAEKPGWDALTGVMSREWNGQVLSASLNNLYLGLGGIKSTDQLDAKFHPAIKAENYAGKRFLDHYSTLTNDPSAGYFFDGLPYAIDPRAYKTFYIPGDVTSDIWSNYPSWTNDASTTTTKLIIGKDDDEKDANENNDIKIDTKNTWSTTAIGDFGVKGTNNGIRSVQVGKIPGLSQKFRNSTNKRIFFAGWESYFLLAEASLKGWTTGTTAQVAYEDGVKANFEYWGVSQYASQYLSSTSYNRAGTSASYMHTTEPGPTHAMTYVDGYTNAPGSANMNYPINTIYKNGSVKNDALTKIITQKYIANMPWLPLEAWNDHRRLGLPFFENPAVENPLPNLPNVTKTNYMTNSIKNFPQRIPYPSVFKNSSVDQYNKAKELLGGPDEVLTPLWWAKKN